MAGKKSYAGIEIEFSANYSDLVEGLSKIDAMSNKLDRDLKTAQKALKLDPENTELMTLAQKALAEAVANTTKKLEMLQSTEAEIKQKYEDKIIPIEQYTKFQAELSKTKSSVETYKQQLIDLHTRENAYAEELNKTKAAYQAVEIETKTAGDRINELVDNMSKAQAELREYSQQASQLGSSDKEAVAEFDRNVEKMTARIEDYKSQINSLIGKDTGLAGSQDILIASTKELSEAQKEATTSATKMGEGYSTTKAIIADLASTVIKKTANALVDFAKGSIEAASSLYEVENVVDVAFEDMRGKVDEFASTSIEAYGISELTAKRTAALFTTMGKAMDLTLDKASDLAIGLAQRSADMASFYDISQDITSTALKSVFTGETESLKRFGVVMTEANLQQYAYTQGIQKKIKEMSIAEKVQLRYNYLMQQTAAAEGDFARTSDSFANKTRQLKERLTETSIVIGNQFIKNLDGAFTTLDDLLAKVKEMGENGELDDTIKDISDILKNLLKMLSAVGEVLLKYPKLTAGAVVGFKSMQMVSKLNAPFKAFAENVGRVAFNMSNATEQTGLLSSKLTMSAGAWAAVGSAAIVATMAIRDAVEASREEIRTQNQLSDELQKEVDAAKEYEKTITDSINSRKENISAIEAEYGSYRDLANKLIDLSNQTEKSSSDLNEMTSIAEQLNSGMSGLGVEVDNTTGALNMQGKEMLDLIDTYEKYYKSQAAFEALQETLKDQYTAQAKYNAAHKKYLEYSTKLNDAYKDRAEAEQELAKIMNSDLDPAVKNAMYVQSGYAEQLENAQKTIDEYEDKVAAAEQKNTEYGEALKDVTEQVETLNGIYDEVKGNYSEIEKRIEGATDATEKQKKALEDLSDAYKKAESAISSYKSEISDLISVQNELNEGTQYSTTQIMDIIDKYPELIGSIQKTKKGYTLETEALENLVTAKAKNLEYTSKQAAELKRQELVTKGLSSNYISMFETAININSLPDIAKVQAGTYTDELQEYLRLYAKSKGIGEIYTDIISEGFKEGKKAETAAKESTKKTAKASSETAKKATKDEAEALIEIFKHRYNQGIIDAETYYTELDRIAKEYYGNEGKYLERYMELEDEAQAGIKKAIEDKAKSYQTLKDKIESVTDARKKLLGIESNKNVLAYQEATGFKLEVNQSDLYNASKNLADAKTGLMEALASMSGDVNIYRSLADKLAAVTGEALENILPELTTEENVPTTQNYTFNFGDIKATGDAEAFKKMLNDFVNSVINETQII